jgi:hypothetical protein
MIECITLKMISIKPCIRSALLATACLAVVAAETGETKDGPPGPPLQGYQIAVREHRFIVMDDREALVGEFVPFTSDAVRGEDVVESAGTNLVRWRRTFSLKPGQPKQSVRLTMDFQAAHQSRFACIPGISWNGNLRDPGNVYHGFDCDGTPWSFASHRTLIPGGTYSEGDHHTVALFAEVNDPIVGLSCSLIPTTSNTVHRLIFPEEELPKRVLRREVKLSPGRSNVLELAPGEQFKTTAWLVLHPVDRPKTGYRFLLDAAWSRFYQPTFARRSAGDLWTMGLRFARESLWDGSANMFHLALKCNPKRGWSKAGGFSIGWCGRNGELANAMLVDFLQTKNQASLDMGLACLDAWVARVEAGSATTNSAGLARFQRIASDANTLSGGATAFLRASQLANQCGVNRPAYREIGLGICDAALTLQKPDGRFEGKGCERGGIGASFIPPLLDAHQLTKDRRYSEAAKSALRFYIGILRQDGCLWGGALDTRSIDKETILPILAGAVRLYELTKDPEILTAAEDAGYYLAAWQFAQTIPNVPGSLMDAVGYDTFGGTSVATVHMCADAYGVSAIPALLGLAKHTGRDIWCQRAAALWSNASQGISTGQFAFQGLPPHPCGSQDETVNYTDWNYSMLLPGIDRERPRGSGSGWLTAWPTAMRLTLLADPEVRKTIETWPVRPHTR